MTSVPLVSLCIPTYNGQEHLSLTLDSLKNIQWPGEYEIVCVDDCSEDNTVSILEEYKPAFQGKLKIFRNDSNLGLVANWNRCIENSKGQWIQFIFQDDLLDQTATDKLYKAAMENQVNLVICDRQYIYEDSARESSRWFIENRLLRLNEIFKGGKLISPTMTSEILLKDFLGSNFLGEPIAGLINRQMIDKYGNYDTNLAQICDFEFWLRISLNENFYYLDKKLVSFRVHGNSQSARSVKRFQIDNSIKDRILVGSKILTHKSFQSIYNDHPELKLIFTQAYKNLLKEYSRRFGFIQLHSITNHIPIASQMLNQIKRQNPYLYLITIRREIGRMIR